VYRLEADVRYIRHTILLRTVEHLNSANYASSTSLTSKIVPFFLMNESKLSFPVGKNRMRHDDVIHAVRCTACIAHSASKAAIESFVRQTHKVAVCFRA
jgi:hypothetical protein